MNMKPVDPMKRRNLFQAMKEVARLIEKGAVEEAAKVAAKAESEIGRTAICAGMRALVANGRGDRAAVAANLDEGLSMAAAGDIDFLRTATRLAERLGNLEFLEKVLRRALELTPSDAEIRHVAGRFCQATGRLDAALRHYVAAVNLKPRYVQAMRDLAALLFELGRKERALKVLDLGQRFDAKLPTMLLELGNARYRAGDFKGSVAAYGCVAALDPLNSPAYSNMGSAYRHILDFPNARQTLRRSIICEPDNGGGYYNLGNLAKETGEIEKAVRYFDISTRLRPETALFHWNLSLALLASGRLDEGFAEYEWRWQTDTFPTKKREFPQPEWGGEPLDGKTLLIIAEQGVGDALQFLRFVPEAARRAKAGKRGGRVLLEVHPEVMTLLTGFSEEVELVERRPGHEPAFDRHVAQLSLPRLLGVRTLDDLPNAPYLRLEEARPFPIPELDPGKLNIGIVWGGNPNFSGDAIRSSKVEFFAPLVEMEGVTCFSLQKGPREADLAGAPAGLVPLSRRIETFADTASIVSQLDLTITTCTSVAHLVGAMGLPLFVLLSHNPDWRWLVGRDDSPWYPSARLFRQSKPGDWPGVIERARAAVEEMRKRKGR